MHLPPVLQEVTQNRGASCSKAGLCGLGGGGAECRHGEMGGQDWCILLCYLTKHKRLLSQSLPAIFSVLVCWWMFKKFFPLQKKTKSYFIVFVNFHATHNPTWLITSYQFSDTKNLNGKISQSGLLRYNQPIGHTILHFRHIYWQNKQINQEVQTSRNNL